jgi:peptidoglycan/LPS O-acetylase OafA/YrhL
VTSYTKHRFHVLDGMRGIAALAVMLFHYHSFGVHSRFFSNTFTAVDFFFVLSGFVLSHAYGEKLRVGTGAGDYLVRRIARLFPLAALGLLIGAPAFYVLSVAGKDAGYSVHNLVVMLSCNLFFLPYLGEWGVRAKDVFPIDHALWSIFLEMLASVAFIWLVRMRGLTLLWIAVASYVALFSAAALSGILPGFYLPSPDMGWNSTNFLGGFPRVLCSFMCGMLLYRLYKLQPMNGLLGFIQRRRIASVPLLYLCLVLTLFFPFYVKGLFSWCAILFVAPFLVIQGGQIECSSHLLSSASEFLGWVSYPIYCLHQPIMNTVKVLDKYDGWSRDASWRAIAIPAALLLAALCAATIDTLHVQPMFAAGLRKVLSLEPSKAA